MYFSFIGLALFIFLNNEWPLLDISLQTEWAATLWKKHVWNDWYV